MRRHMLTIGVIALLATLGCSPERSSHLEGLMTAGVARPVAEEVPDSIHTVTRRIWYGTGTRIDRQTSPHPDGRMISTLDDETGCEVALRDLETGETRQLTDHNPGDCDEGWFDSGVVSPDGRMVAYVWLGWPADSSDFWVLRVLEVETGMDRVLWSETMGSPGSSYMRVRAWFPDGRSVLGSRVTAPHWGNNQLVRVSVDDGSASVLLDQLGDLAIETVAVSRDGRFVAFDQRSATGEPMEVHVLRLADGRLETLLSSSDDVMLFGWSRMSDHLLFRSMRGGTPGLWTVPLRDGRVAGSAELVLPGAWNLTPVGFATGGAFFYGVQVGRRSLYVTTLSDDFLKVVSPPAPAVPQSARHHVWPDWSPDGRFLGFIESRGDQRIRAGGGDAPDAIVVRNVETGEARSLELAGGLRPLGGLRWMPDGVSLLVVAQSDGPDVCGNTDRGIYQVDLQTGVPTAVVSERMVSANFDVSPDGRFLYYVRCDGDNYNENWQILRRDLRDSTETLIRSGFGALAVSPDGAMIALRMRDNVGIMDTGATRWKLLLEDSEVARGATLTWTPDASSLLVTRPNAGGIAEAGTRTFRVEISGGEPQLLDTGTDELAGGPRSIGFPRFHPDGQRIVFVTGEVINELWMMENFLPGSEGGGN